MEIVNTFLQYALWPIVVLVVILMFRKTIVGLLKNIKSLKAGSLELGFSEQLMSQGFNEDQLKIIQSLTAKEIDLFLLASFSNSSDFQYETDWDGHDYLKSMIKLEKAGLFVLKNKSDYTKVTHLTTTLGQRVRAMLINSTVSLLQINQ